MTRTRINPKSTRTSTSTGFLGRAFAAMIGARERQAHHQVNMFLLGLDDESLARLGYDRKTLEAEGPQGPF